jgi:hypothetical protein
MRETDLSDRHDAALEQAAEARARMQEVAGRIADTEEYAAGVLEDVAADSPERADHLRAMAARAREFAEQERDVSEGRQPS